MSNGKNGDDQQQGDNGQDTGGDSETGKPIDDPSKHSSPNREGWS